MKTLVLASVVALFGLSGAEVQASPCERPQDFVRPADAGKARAVMLRPYVLNGMAVVAVQQRAGQRWLEIAVDSAATVRRTMNLLDEGARRQVLDDGPQVLLACDSGRATVQAGESQQRLW